jgi:hypothetical protein
MNDAFELNDGWYQVLERASQVAANDREMEMLPTLRARYGDMLRAAIFSVVLERIPGSTEINVHIWEMPLSCRTVTVEVEVVSNGLFQTAYPFLEKITDDPSLVLKLKLFKAHSETWLARCADAEQAVTANSDADDASRKNAQSCQKNLRDVADHFAPGLAKTFIEKARKQLRSSPSHGVDEHEAVKTEWDELGCMQNESGHLLAQMGRDTLAWTLEKQFNALDESEKLLLWIKYGDGASEIESQAGEYVHPSDYGGAYKQVLEYLNRKIVRAALNDWENKSDAS